MLSIKSCIIYKSFITEVMGMTTKKKWVTFFPDDELLEAIIEYQHKMKLPSRSRAIQEICKMYLLEKGFYNTNEPIG